MSRISDFKSSPITLYGVNGGNTTNDASLSTLLGAKFRGTDDRTYALVQNGASALVSGVLVQSPASIGANHTDLAVVAAVVIGGTQVNVTLGGTAVTANQYASGYAVVSAGTGKGQTLKIASHPAQSSTTGNVLITVEDPISVALDTTSTISLTLPQFGSANGTAVSTFGVVINPTTATGRVVGATVYPIPASTSTVATYAFVQTSGPVGVLNDSVTAIGLDVMPSSSVAGAVVTYVAATRNRVGTSTVAGQNTKVELITLQL